jgi:hypothetical protein
MLKKHTKQKQIKKTKLSLQLIILDSSLFFHSTYPVNSIAKEIVWAEIYRGRLFLRAEIYRGRLFIRGKTRRSNCCPPWTNSEHRKMRAQQQHVCKERNQYILYIRSIPPEMDSKWRHRMDNRSEVQEIAF